MGRKHTPGPWVIIPAQPYDDDDDDLIGSYVSPASIEGADGNPVCVFGSSEGSGCLFENEADYHLIKAAPDMKAALLGLTGIMNRAESNASGNPEWETVSKRINAAREAISRALGQSS